MRLELKKIRQQYGDKIIIKDMDIIFENGLYGFLGPNGAGKSTTIRMICTVEQPVSGGIMYDGADVFEMGEEYRSKLGYAPQRAGYYPNYTVYKFMQYMAGLKDIPVNGEAIKKCLETVALWGEKEKKMKELSGGMKQRVNIAQALLNDPQILILDEPTVGLDPNERLNLKNLLMELAENKIIIFASHIVSDVEDIADRVVILNKGVICMNVSMEDAMKMAANNVWECTLRDNNKIKQLRTQYKECKMQRHKDGVLLRIVSDEKPCEEAVPADGSLEELYLSILKNKKG